MSYSLLSLILNACLLTLAALALIYSVRMFLRRQWAPDPQKSRQIARIIIGPMILGIAIMLAIGQIRPEKQTLSFILAIPMIFIALRYAWVIFHETSEDDAIANF